MTPIRKCAYRLSLSLSGLILAFAVSTAAAAGGRPWYWWWCFPGGIGEGTVVRNEDSTSELGYNLGLGYSFSAGDGQLFIEAKYHLIQTDSRDITYLPVSIGYRW